MPAVWRFIRRASIALACNLPICAVAAAAPATSTAGIAPGSVTATTAVDRPLLRPSLPKEADDSPDEALRFFLKKRLAPGMAHYPVDRLLQAQREAARLPLFSSRAGSAIVAPEGSLAAQALTWSALGPGNVGGRTRAFAFQPGSSTTIYAAGVAGGVWKTTNSGTSWSPLGDAMANMAVTALLVDPSNTNVLYAGTGEGFFNSDGVSGAGIFKSTNGGTSWAQLSSTNNVNFAFVNSLAFKPGNSAVIYAATSDLADASGAGGLFRSTDSGASWTRVIDASNSLGCMKVVYRSDVDTAVASCGTFRSTAISNGIWRSTNASAASPTWTHVLGPAGSGATQTRANMGRIGLAIAPSSQATMYALISCSSASQCGTGNHFVNGLLAVYKSTDGGGTWNAVYTSTFNGSVIADLLLTNPEAQLCEGRPDFNQGWYDNTIAVDPTNANRVFVGGVEAFRSDDGGATWGTIAYWWLGGQGIAQYEHADHHGLTFHPNYNGSSETRVYDINDGGIFVATNAATATKATTKTNVCPTLVSQLQGASWTELDNGYAVTQFYHGTVYPSGTEYFAGAQDNGTNRGTDGSPNAWSEILGGDGGWTAIDKNTSGGSTVLYAENPGISIVKSISDGSTNSFQCATQGIVDCSTGTANDSGQFINPFQMDPNNAQRLFTSGQKLWRTANAAASWSQASAALTGTCSNANPERFTNYAIAPGNSDLLIAGTDNGRICRLTNATTSNSGSAMQSCTQPAGACTYVSEIAFDPNNAASAYASVSTFGVGHVWKSTNSGQSWTNISGTGLNALPDSPAHSVAVSPNDGNTIYVGTEIGVFVTTDGGTNWARENTGFANVITDHLVFSPTGATGQTLYAFTHGRGVFRAPIANSKVASTTILSSSPDPSVFGQGVTLTATVTGGSGTPTGSVSFKDGATTLAANVALNGSGVATFSTATFSIGSHGSLSGVYGGDSTYLTSTGNDTQTVNKANSTVTVSADTPDPSVVGQSVSVSAGVVATAPATGTPTGSITVSGTNTSGTCTITLPATSCNLTFTATGSQTISANYSGDTDFNASSTGVTTAHTVNKANTTVSISTATPDPSVVGQTVNVTAGVTAASPGAGTPTGTITVNGTGASGQCTITLPATSCNLTFVTPGAQTIGATYNGDNHFNASSTAAGTAHTVNKANTTVSISGDAPDASVTGQSVSVTAGVVAASPGAGTPTGSITVSGTGASANCTITLPATSCNLTFTSAGPQTISATYNGDSKFNSSNSTSPTAHTVDKAGTTLSIVDSNDPSLAGESVTVTRTLGVSAPGAGTPTGTINVTGTHTAGCSIALPATGCQLSFDASGAQTIDASYSGDANFAGSTAAQISHTVSPTANLSVSNSDGTILAINALPLTYTIVVSNAGPDTATGAVLTDTPPAGLSGAAWTCTPTPPATCPHASGSGAIGETVTLSAGQTLTYALTGIVAGSVGAQLVNTAQIAAAAGTGDADNGNNVATDTDTIRDDDIFQDGFN